MMTSETADELDRMGDVIAALAKGHADFSAGLALAVGKLRIRARALRSEDQPR